MKQNIQISEVISIDTPENRCALAFGMELQHHLPKGTRTLLLTANKPELVRTNLEHIQQYLPDFNTIHENTTYLFLKENWGAMYDQYGIKAFENELKHLVEKKEFDLYYFHRLDLFFDKQFTPDIQKCIIHFIESIRYHHKKVLFSYNNQTVSGKSFEVLLEDKRDLSFDVILNDDDKCDLTMKTHNRLLKKEAMNICLISDQKEMHYLHQAILKNEPNIKLSVIDLADLQKKDVPLSKETDLIIYNDSRKFLNKTMVNALKKFSPYAQIFWLTNRKSIRKSDLNESKEIGIDHLFPKTFDIKEYVHYIEHAIQKQFYTTKLQSLSYLNQAQRVDHKTFVRRIAELEKKHILFSIVTVKASEIHTDDIVTYVRKEDFVYIDHDTNIALFVMVNLLIENAKQIIAERTNVSKTYIHHHDHQSIKQLIRE